MPRMQYTKIGPFEQALKGQLRTLRLDHGYGVQEGADVIGVTRKQMEDIETIRNYGCHISADLLKAYCDHYGDDVVLKRMKAALAEVRRVQ